MFENDIAKWRKAAIRRVGDGQSKWSYCGVLVAAEVLHNVHAPAAWWDVFNTPSYAVSNLSVIEAARTAIRSGHYERLPTSTFDLLADAWLTYIAVERPTSAQQRALAVEMIDPYEPHDCDHIADAPYLVPAGDLTRLKLVFSFDLKETGLWFVEALD
jgi:hypothetical protein